jgi:hypothetical protein
MDRELVSFKKNSKEQVKVILSDFQGRRILNIRVFYLSKDGEWKPSPKGLAFAVEKLPILLAALSQAGRLIDQDAGVLPSDGVTDPQLLSEEERKLLCEKFGIDASEIDEIFGA